MIQSLKIAAWWLPKLLRVGGPDLYLSSEGLTWCVNPSRDQSRLSTAEIQTASILQGFLWSTIVIGSQYQDGTPHSKSGQLEHRFGGLRKPEAEYFVNMVRSAVATERLRKLEKEIDGVLGEWNRPAGKDQFLTQPKYRRWLEDAAPLVGKLRIILQDKPNNGDLTHRATDLVRNWIDKGPAREKRNVSWSVDQRVRHADLFAKGMGYPLSDEQIHSILRDEHRSLVVAGAGTGKTSTIVAKVQWILANGLSESSRIKCLAFNKKAVAEVNDRLGIRVEKDSIASTFHSLGMSLVAQACGRKPRLTKLSEDDRLLQGFLRSCINTGLKTPEIAGKVLEFLAYFRYPEPNPVPVELSHEANRWAEGHGIRSITGVLLRSNSEVIIANWLTLHGINWEYETEYAHDTATVRYGQYRPDFYLPEHKIYIEHWACSRSGDFPPDWDERGKGKYREGLEWKRDLHKQHKTHLIQTYSSINARREVVGDLEGGLRSMGVKPTPLREEERNKLVMVDEVIDPVVLLIKNFLALYRESGATYNSLRMKLSLAQDARGRAFLDMFEWVHDQYVAHLESEGAIDFADMIREATDALRSGNSKLELDYLLVDEFQDISRGRVDLLKAILDQNTECRLFTVGDDWQSIYRFAGSDVQIMTEFLDEFEHTERNDLRQTHRFGSNLLAVTSAFIQANPQQLKKNLSAARVDRFPAIEIVSAESASRSVLAHASLSAKTAVSASTQEEMQNEVPSQGDAMVDADNAAIQALNQILHRIDNEQDGNSVLVLGRYNFLEKRLSDAMTHLKDLRITFSTVHKAKGLEADYAVVLDVVTGRYGFPSEIEDDPIMNMVLSVEPGIPNAEERRLFYVALTRAKKKAFVMTSDHHRSPFVDELESNAFRGLVIPSEAKSRVANCPVCGGSTLRQVISRYGAFYACSSTRCIGKAFKCPHCGNGGLVRGTSRFTCLFCQKTAECCPNCDRGYLKHINAGVSKAGKQYIAFDACSTNKNDPHFTCFKRTCRCISPVVVTGLEEITDKPNPIVGSYHVGSDDLEAHASSDKFNADRNLLDEPCMEVVKKDRDKSAGVFSPPKPVALDAEEALLRRLKDLRIKFAAARNIPVYLVFSDSTLQEMARSKPETEEQFYVISGVNTKKLERYGTAFIEAIRAFVNH